MDTRERVVNHLVLVYRPGEADLACRVLEMLGCELKNMGPHRETTQDWYFVHVDPTSSLAENILFLLPAAPEQLALDEQIAQALGTRAMSGNGRSKAHEAYSELVVRDPERTFHFGIRYSSFDALETTALAVRQAGENDPQLSGRVGICMQFRPAAGDDPMVDRRIDASSLFTPESRSSLGKRGVQVYVRTDVLASGSLALDHVIELQHVFPLDGDAYAQRAEFG